MVYEVIKGVLLPFLGTVLGSLCVFLMKDEVAFAIESILCGFAGGVMIAASVWSLLLPSLNYSSEMGAFACVPTIIGFVIGVLLVWSLDLLVERILQSKTLITGSQSIARSSVITVTAISVHNIPEGMAVGIVYAGIAFGNMDTSAELAFALAFGIALQNFPEGAIVSMPLRSKGMSKQRSFGIGVISGIVELLGSLVTLLIAGYVISVMPYMLALAAGAMMYVVAVELLPQMMSQGRNFMGVMAFTFGFCVMMAMDTALG